ncbi:MAG: zinc-ribbon domain-containing protein [Burkholderiales bacterium]
MTLSKVQPMFEVIAAAVALVWVLSVILAWSVARSKGRNPWLWGFLALLFAGFLSWVVAAIVVFLPARPGSRDAAEQAALDAEDRLHDAKTEKCPYCGTRVSPHDKTCPDCGRPLEEPVSSVS